MAQPRNERRNDSDVGRHAYGRHPHDDAHRVAFAYALATLRQEAGLSQGDLARLLNTTQSAVSELETGVIANPGIGTLQRYARACGHRLTFKLEKL